VVTMKQEFKAVDMCWEAMNFDVNTEKFKPYNVLAYREDFIKKLKKKVSTKEEFTQQMKREMMYYFWSKCEWEVILTNKDGRIIMSPWVGPENITLDVTDREDFDWVDFFSQQAKRYINKISIKIDIWDQIFYQWDAFIDYCWNFHHKWQRRKNKHLFKT
jgi:hypothetical protein